MDVARFEDLSIHYRDEGPRDGPVIVFGNSLGTDLRLWDKIVPQLPDKYRIIRFDKRGHGLTSCTPAPYKIGRLISDVERLLDHLGVRECLFVGLSIGGLLAQGLAAKRPDLIKAMVLSNTAVKIGTAEIWNDRIAAVRAGGVESLADAVMERWFGRKFLAGPELSAWRAMLVNTTDQGYAGCAAAISGADFYATTAALTLPTLVIAGSEDGATPPDLVRETADLIHGARFHLIRGAGHLPCVEAPEEYARVLNGFIAEAYA